MRDGEACGAVRIFSLLSRINASINFGLMHAARLSTHTHTLYWWKYTSGTLANNKVFHGISVAAAAVYCTEHLRIYACVGSKK
jgi:hypothetical protein